MNVKYCGPAFDYSGYGEANRHDIGALTAAGVNVTGEYTRHCLEIAEFGELGQLCRDIADRPLECRIKILHTTPNIFGRYIEPGKYHIGRVFWETDKLPPSFAAGAQACDEIWTGSQFNADAIRKAGVTKPIFIIPEAIKIPAPTTKAFMTLNADDFKFYSIFEWTERKNPTKLLTAFWREFQGSTNVSLTLKVYVDNFTKDKQLEIRAKFSMLKKQLKLEKYAPVYIITKLLTRDEIYRIHNTFDCYVSAHRGEGWGIPQMEAMLAGKPVISTNCGGIHEYIAGVSKLVSCKMVPLENPDRNQQWYLPDQNWAEVNLPELRKAMRWVFDHQDKAVKMGQMGQKLAQKEFSFETVGKKMLSRLTEIEKALDNNQTTGLQSKP